jgi:fatty acid desaturase
VAAREAVVERRRPCPASRCLARAVRLDVNLDSESGRVVSPAVRSLLARAVAVRALAVRALAAGSELQPPRASRGKVVSQGRAGRVAAAEAAGRVAVAGAVLAVAVLVLAVLVVLVVLAVLAVLVVLVLVLVVVLDGQLEGRLPEPAACAARVFADMAHRSRL